MGYVCACVRACVRVCVRARACVLACVRVCMIVTCCSAHWEHTVAFPLNSNFTNISQCCYGILHVLFYCGYVSIRLYSVIWWGDCWMMNWKWFGSGRDLILVLCWHLPGRIEEWNKKSQKSWCPSRGSNWGECSTCSSALGALLNTSAYVSPYLILIQWFLQFFVTVAWVQHSDFYSIVE
jgi:hypothetical protein